MQKILNRSSNIGSRLSAGLPSLGGWDGYSLLQGATMRHPSNSPRVGYSPREKYPMGKILDQGLDKIFPLDYPMRIYSIDENLHPLEASQASLRQPRQGWDLRPGLIPGTL